MKINEWKDFLTNEPELKQQALRIKENLPLFLARSLNLSYQRDTKRNWIEISEHYPSRDISVDPGMGHPNFKDTSEKYSMNGVSLAENTIY